MMADPEHSFRKLLPGFVISAGTQVVLKVAKALPDGQQFKPPGSVGVVLESPPDNQQPYLVRFADGETVTAFFHELALRRREVEDELGEVTEDLRPWIIYRCQVGSKAFGLASEDSDDDLRGHLPAAGPAALVAAAAAGATGVRGRASGTKSTGSWRSSCGWR